jgi:hypothetical protein
MIANGKRRKTRIFRLKQERIVEGEENLIAISQNIIRIFSGDHKLAIYHSMSLWWRIFLRSPIR